MSKDQAEHLKKSIERFGVCEPIVANVDGTIIGGHQRVRTLKKLGYKQVDVYIPDTALDDKQEEELNIRLNRNVGEFDFDILANEWQVEDLLAWGFSAAELQIAEDIDDTDKPSKAVMTITFKNQEQLQEAESKISEVIENYEGATYKKRL
jgi:ParB-like chromosome segregation protein Spo0J